MTGELSAEWTAAVDDWAAWLRVSGLARTTIDLRRQTVKSVGRRLEVEQPSDVTLRALVRLCSDADWSLEYRKVVRVSLVFFFDWCVDNGVVESNPASGLPMVRLARPKPKPIPDDVWQAVIAKAGPRELLILRLAGEAGLRRGEIARLHRDDLIGRRGEFSLRVLGKGRKLRIVPITDQLAAAVAGYRSAGWVFEGQEDGHISANYVSDLISRMLPRGYTLHGARHRFATRAYRGSRNLRAVQELLGHASVATTERYTAVDSVEIRAAMESAGTI